MLARVMVVIPSDDAVGENVTVNTFGFDVPGGGAANGIAITAALKAMYDPWAAYRGALADWPKAHCIGYDLSQAKPRAPIWDLPMNLSLSQATNTSPTECAVCLSFQGARASGAAQARRRGRVYLGPFSQAANDATKARPDNGLRTGIITGAQALLTASNTDAEWQWVVISEATGVPVPVPVTNGWVDDAWDIQRRRGIDPTTRTLFGTPG